MAKNDARDFRRQLGRFGKNLEDRLDRVVKSAVLEAGTRIIQRTPVDTGRARGGWQTSVGAAPSGPAPDRAPEAAQAELEATAAEARLGDRVVISNNVEYIRVLEDGSSAQAPNGMVAVTAREWPQIVRRAVEDVEL